MGWFIAMAGSLGAAIACDPEESGEANRRTPGLTHEQPGGPIDAASPVPDAATGVDATTPVDATTIPDAQRRTDAFDGSSADGGRNSRLPGEVHRARCARL